MTNRWRCSSALILFVLIAQGCVTVHAPLNPDEVFPREWGEISALGPECKALEGTYVNDGVVTAAPGKEQSISLTSVFNFESTARTVSLSVRTRRFDKDGDAFSTLIIVSDRNASDFREFEGCFCIKQTLACTQLFVESWSVPNFGLGGSQKNAYFSVSKDGSLIAKLQHYHADVILAIPVFRMREPWARFRKAYE